MASSFGMEVTGWKEIDKRLRALPKKVAKKTIKVAARAAAKDVMEASRADSPEDTGLMRRSIVIRTPRRKRKGEYGLFVGFKKARLADIRDKSGKGGFYPAHLEYGTDKMPARPFMRTAYDRTKRAAADKMGRMIRDGVERAARGGSG